MQQQQGHKAAQSSPVQKESVAEACLNPTVRTKMASIATNVSDRIH